MVRFFPGASGPVQSDPEAWGGGKDGGREPKRRQGIMEEEQGEPWTGEQNKGGGGGEG